MQTPVPIEVEVNGASMQVPSGLTVSGLLGLLELSDKKAAVERNREIVPRSAHAATLLVAGDRLEIVHFVGGG